jgi:hypothetical protein
MKIFYLTIILNCVIVVIKMGTSSAHIIEMIGLYESNYRLNNMYPHMMVGDQGLKIIPKERDSPFIGIGTTQKPY